MADDKNFKELVKEMQDLNKSITKQNEGLKVKLTDLTNAQDKTTEMVTRRLTKSTDSTIRTKIMNKLRLIKKQQYVAEKSAKVARKDSRMKMLATRVSD